MPERPVKLTRRGLIALGSGAALAGVLSAPTFSAGPSPLRRGVNLYPWFSLTREYPPPRKDYPWPPFQRERPVPTEQDLRRVREAGFDFVRLPVDPGPFLAADGRHLPNLLDELVSAVVSVRKAGLALVINIHPNESTHHWNSRLLLDGQDEGGFGVYLHFVTDLSRRLVQLGDDRIVLEPANEPPQACGALEWRRMQGLLLASAARAAPGLGLIGTGACGSMIDGLSAMGLPDVPPGTHLRFTFHFYEPYLFSHQGAEWMGDEIIYPYLDQVPWPASTGSLDRTLKAVRAKLEADPTLTAKRRAEILAEAEDPLVAYFEADPARWFIQEHLGRVKRWADANAVPMDLILLGEFGATKTRSGHSTPDRARYVADVRSVAEELGMSWAFWNLFDRMGLMDDGSRRFDRTILEALGLRA